MAMCVCVLVQISLENKLTTNYKNKTKKLRFVYCLLKCINFI